ncbi:MAG TPA: PKD domain-containing protein [Candidatus Acidoferrum sp.]|nr:PKD domain-containing protein [Candidatus Acidoferrum sp.]
MRTAFHLSITVLLLTTSNVLAVTHYVAPSGSSPTPPYTNWATAATNIQQAVNAAAANDNVLVTNGVYPGGVIVTNPLALLSVNGPEFAVIDGGGTNRCVSLNNGASLAGFTLTNGWASDNGGGVWCASTNAFVTNCVIVGNSANGGPTSCGGGAYLGSLDHCTLAGNSAAYGGGVFGSRLSTCVLAGNGAQWDGGGAMQSTLSNCTLTGNSAVTQGGGAFGCTLYNCIVYLNGANIGANYNICTLNFCCTTPLPDGAGNIALDPQLASASHLSAGSPCRSAGSAAYATGTDIDGEPWDNPPSIGCDEYHVGDVTGPLAVDWRANYRAVTPGYQVAFAALIEGKTSASVWDFGDGVVASNLPYASHSWTAPGDYTVVLSAFNESQPAGVSATGIVHVATQLRYYVAATSTNPQPPYLSWSTAATNIQAAVDATLPGVPAGTLLVVVTNGTYAGGVNVGKSLTLLSVNGPQFSVIDGGGTTRCVSLSGGACLTGFTLTNGSGGVQSDASGVVSNCVITGNSGTGASGGTLYNCALNGNSGFGASGAALYNCTLTGNAGGGVSGCTVYNSLVYFNMASGGTNYRTSTLNYCCTTPLPAGVGNIALDPQLASASHLSAGSPCRSAGSAAYATGADIDGEPWSNPPSIGCDEYRTGDVTGPLIVELMANYTNVTVGYPVSLTALIDGRTTLSVWAFGDGIIASNQPYASHAWAAPGDYAVVLSAYNESYPGGVSATVTIHVVTQPVRYVSATSANPQPPYASWATAAMNIQDAVNAPLQVPGTFAVVVVTNGIYPGGVTVTKPLALVSVNGPQFTVISGGGVNQCISLTNGASLTGFTLTNGMTKNNGGGVWCASTNALVINCVIAGNFGGGAFGGTLYNCALTGNSAQVSGGGAYGSTLYNCTVTGNSAIAGRGGGFGGGACNCALYNCIVYFNSATATNATNYYSCTISYCCTTPQPTNGVGNITNAPLFVNYAGGNLRLQSNSPCINAGNNAYATAATDLDGNPRIVGGTVDMGAYECQSPAFLDYYLWLQGYGLPTDASATYADTDGDGMNNWQEYLADTSPIDANDYFHITSFTRSGTYNTLWWTSKPTRLYQVQRCFALDGSSPWETIITNATPGWNNVGFDNTGPQYFYRIGAVRP